MHRRSIDLIRGLTATVLLLVLLIGLPLALVSVVGWPLPTVLPTRAAFERAFVSGELDSWTLVKAIAVLVWIAWAQLAASTFAELVAVLRGRQVVHVPSTRPLRLAVTNLVATAAVLFSGASRGTDAPAAPPELHVALATTPSTAAFGGDADDHDVHGLRAQFAGAPSVTPTPDAGDGTDASPSWRVAPRDTLWGIADAALGDGLRWREIHALNVGRPQPDGDAVRSDDDLIRPGWNLALPSDAATAAPATAPPTEVTAAETVPVDTGSTITVEPGDTLWGLAGTHLADEHRWPELYEANLGHQQPDGRSLTDPDLIHPDWQLRIPTDHEVAPPESGKREDPASTSDETNEATTSKPRPFVPWSKLDPVGPPSAAPSQADRRPRTDDHATSEANAEDTSPLDRPEAAGSEAAPDGGLVDWDRLVVVAGAGLLAAGATVTIDRLRRARLRRRQPGQRIRLPEGELARTEQRIRGLADPSTADLLDVALRALAAACRDEDRDVPDIALVSVGPGDVAVHLATADDDPPGDWHVEDGGMTWVLPQPAALDALCEQAATSLAPTPLLVTIGTHARSQRRVLLNLGHARLLDIEADEETGRRMLLAQALELATTSRADGLQVLLADTGERLATLERVRCLPGNDANGFLRRALDDEGTEDGTGATVAFFHGHFPDGPPQGLIDEDVQSTAGRVAAVGRGLPAARWRLTVEATMVKLAPYNLELEPLELTEDDLAAIEALLIDAANATFVEADPGEMEPEVPAPNSTNHHTTEPAEPDMPPPDAETEIEIRVLGRVEIAGADHFGSAKAEELVIYLALQRGPVDADTLQEALWPGEAPNVRRLQTAVWRARQALGDRPDGKPYLPRALKGCYRLAEGTRIDLVAFRDHVTRAKALPDHAVEELRAALELVRGRPMSAAGSEYAWVTHELHRIEQQIADAAHDLAQLYLEHDEPALAGLAAERGLLADPYSEILHRDLMTAAAHGDRAEEIPAIMRRLRRLLDDDANDSDDRVDPATDDLYDELESRRHGLKRSAG